MQVTLENLEGLERRMTFGIPEQNIFEAVESRIKQLARQVKIDGFRKGKVPKAVVSQQFGPQVRQEVIGDLLLSTFYQAAAQEKLKLASQPLIQWKQALTPTEEMPLEFEAVFEVYPDFELSPVVSIQVEKPVTEVTAEDVDAMLAALQRLNLEWHPVERAAKIGDRVMVNMQGYMDGEALREIRQIPFILGQPSQGGPFGSIVQDEFARQIVGVEPGRFVDMEIGFPDEYPKSHLAGQNVRFTLHLHSIEEPHLPEIDEALARKLGIESGGVEALRQQTLAMMEDELQQVQRESLKAQVLDGLIAANPVAIPKSRLEAETTFLLQQVKARMKADGLQEEDAELASLLVENQARRRISLGLILAKIVRDNGLSVPKASIEGMLEKLAPGPDQPKEAREEWQRHHQDLVAELESSVLEDQVVAWVLERAQIAEKPIKFSDFMQDRLKTDP